MATVATLGIWPTNYGAGSTFNSRGQLSWRAFLTFQSIGQGPWVWIILEVLRNTNSHNYNQLISGGIINSFLLWTKGRCDFCL